MDFLHAPNFIKKSQGFGEMLFEEVILSQNSSRCVFPHTYQAMYYVDYVYSYVSMFMIMGYEKFSEARQHREKVRDERRKACRNQ